MIIHRSISEWGALRLTEKGEDALGIPELAAQRLTAVSSRSEFARGESNQVLQFGRQYLKAKGIVGVVSAPGCSLEILPKIDVVDSETSDDGSIRRRLVHMLSVAHDLKIDVGALTSLDWQSNSILEIFIAAYSEKLGDALRAGMPRRYVSQEEDLRTLRGSLQVVRQFRRNAANPSILACRFDELSKDVPLNQIMKTTLMSLLNFSRNWRNKKRLRELLFAYGSVSTIPSQFLPWHQVLIDRSNTRWTELLRLAELLLSRNYQTTTTGQSEGFALLFEMHDLFERYVGTLMSKELSTNGYQVSLQGGRRYCLAEVQTRRELFQTKPDIVIRRGGDVMHIIDTKWKRISARDDDKKRGITQGDVYQMMAYAQLYNAPRVTLLYPHHGQLEQPMGLLDEYKINGGESRVAIGTYDVGRDPTRKELSEWLASLQL